MAGGYLTYVSYVGTSFTLIEIDGVDAIIGSFNGLPEGAPMKLESQNFAISYQGGTGNDLVLSLASGGLPPLAVGTFTIVPAPGDPATNVVLIEATGQPGALHVSDASTGLVNWQVIGAALSATEQRWI